MFVIVDTIGFGQFLETVSRLGFDGYFGFTTLKSSAMKFETENDAESFVASKNIKDVVIKNIDDVVDEVPFM